MVHARRLQNQRNAGFTLMEAMVVVAIIGISAALAAPAIGEAVSERRTNEATHAVVRIGARARAEAMAYGRAHVLVYTDASAGTPASNGKLQLWRGMSNLCSANNWGSIITGSCGAGGDANCRDVLDMGASYNYGSNQVRLRMPNAAQAYICFQPDGEMYVSTGGGTFTPTSPDGRSGGVRFTIDRLRSGGAEGVQRVVIFPFGGEPRIAR